MSVKTSDFESKLPLIQQQLDGASDFFQTSSIKLNATKSALVVFSTNYHVRNKDVQLYISGDTVPRVHDQRMLGLYVDEAMTYAKHCDMWQKRVYARVKVLNHICSRSWGTSFKSTKQLAEQFILSSALYASPGFYGCISSKKNYSKLHTAYNTVLRLISGCLKMTKTKKLPDIVGWEALGDRISRRAAHLTLAVLQHPQDSPAKQMMCIEIKRKKRLKRNSWRDLSERFLPRDMHVLITPLPPRLAPWLSLKIHFSTTMCSRSDDEQKRKNMGCMSLGYARDRLNMYNGDKWESWSDGSVDLESGYGGAGSAVWKCSVYENAEHNYPSMNSLWNKEAPAGKIASSYTSEIIALQNSCIFLQQHPLSAIDTLLFVVDSLSLYTALQNDPYNMSPDIIHLWTLLFGLSHSVGCCEFVWISSHCGIIRNDFVDELAKYGTTLNQDECHLFPSVVKSYVNRDRVRKPLIDLPDILPDLGDHVVSKRYIYSNINQIISGYWSVCHDYLFKIGKVDNPFCRVCTDDDHNIVDDIEHRLFTCRKYENIRIQCFGCSPVMADKDDFVRNNSSSVARFVALARGM